MISLNQNVMERVNRLITQSEILRCHTFTLDNGTTVIDVGLEIPGSWESSKLLAEIDMGGLGSCTYGHYSLSDTITVPTVEITIDQPILACIYSQMGGLKIDAGQFSMIGSGPARSLAAAPDDPFYIFNAYHDDFDKAVLCVQTIILPDVETANMFAQKCKVSPENLILLAHNNSSLAASVQVSARIVEQTMNKMIKHKFDINSVVYAKGWCVVAPVVRNELEAMGRINDCLLYGGESDFWVDSDDAHIESVIDKLVTRGTQGYGRKFAQLYREANCDFHKMDKEIHSPAKVQIFNMRTGKVHIRGEIDREVLRNSLFSPIEGSCMQQIII